MTTTAIRGLADSARDRSTGSPAPDRHTARRLIPPDPASLTVTSDVVRLAQRRAGNAAIARWIAARGAGPVLARRRITLSTRRVVPGSEDEDPRVLALGLPTLSVDELRDALGVLMGRVDAGLTRWEHDAIDMIEHELEGRRQAARMQADEGPQAPGGELPAHADAAAEQRRQQDVLARFEALPGVRRNFDALAVAYFPWTWRLRYRETMRNYVRARVLGLVGHHRWASPEVIALLIAQEVTAGAEAAAELGEIVEHLLAQLPAPASTEANRALIVQALYPDAGEILEETPPRVAPAVIEFARARASLVLLNVTAVCMRIESDWALLQRQFGLRRKLRWIHFTGSDLHLAGQQVMIVEDSEGGRVVYKPRDVTAEQALLDPDQGLFHQLNALGEGIVVLPTMRVADRGGKHPYGYVEFQERCVLKTVEQIREHYRRFGQLVVAAKLLGITDLHEENIMAVLSGPTIVDAETAFLPYVFLAPGVDVTLIGRALTTAIDVHGRELANTAFYTEAELEAFGGDPAAPGFAQFVHEARRRDLAPSSPFRASLHAGLSEMLALVRRHQAQLVERLLVTAHGVTGLRVVPLATSDFMRLLIAYRDWVRQDPRAEGVIDTLRAAASQIDASLQRKRFKLVAVSSEPGSPFMTELEVDFQVGDTPIFHFDPQTNGLYLHDLLVARHSDWSYSSMLVHMSVASLAKLGPDDILAELLPD